MMATVPYVISGLGLRKFQTDGFLLTRVYIWTGSRFLVMCHMACNWICSQAVNVLLVGPVQLFPLPWFSGGCVFALFVCVLLCLCVLRILSLHLNL